MNDISFEWDPTKNQSNIQKHGVSFEEASSVFFDDNARVIPDPDHSAKEERFIILGFSRMANLLVVCHCYRDNDNVIRIISARQATSTEEKQYETGI